MSATGDGVKGTIDVVGTNNRVVEKFDNGMQLTVMLEGDGKSITYAYSEPVNGVRGFAINLKIPIAYAKGGKFGLGKAELQNFPEVPGKDECVAKGDFGIFRLRSPARSSRWPPRC